MARSSTQFLAHRHASRICHHHRYLCLLLIHSKPVQSGFSMVSHTHNHYSPLHTFSRKLTIAPLQQAIPLLRSHRLPRHTLHSHNPRPHSPAPTTPRHSNARFLHPLRPLPHRPYRNIHPTLRPHRIRKQLLQYLHPQHRIYKRPGAGDASIFGDAGDM